MIAQTPDLLLPRELAVECVDTECEFLELEGKWNQLLMENERPVPFLTWEWISTWWKHFASGSRLFILVAKTKDGEVAGIAPLRITTRNAFGVVPVRFVEFLGYQGSVVCADHLDFLTSRRNREGVYVALLDALLSRRGEWDCLKFGDLAQDSLLPGLLPGLASDNALTFQPGPAERCPYLTLPAEWELLLNSMKAKRRSFIKTRRQRMEKEHLVHFDCNSAPDHVEEQLCILERLHKLARQRKGGEGNFAVSKYRDFHHELAQRMAVAGQLYLARLDCNGSPTASVYGFFLKGRLFYYQTGFDPAWASQGAGSVLLGRVIEDVITRLHAKEFDFLRGDESYKYSWTKDERIMQTQLFWSRSVNARLAAAEFVGRRAFSGIRSRLGEWTATAKNSIRRAGPVHAPSVTNAATPGETHKGNHVSD
jgi:CelD/BcsL family acetyltransferase involved in cellulose biosynthesis